MKETRAIIAEAEAKLSQKDYALAHKLAMRALESDPACADALFLLAMIGAEHGNFDKALPILDRAIAIDAAQARFHAQRGRCLARLRRLAEARDAAERAAALKPDDSVTLDTIGVIFSYGGFHDRAIAFYEQAAARDARNPNILHNLGVSRQFVGDFEGARAAFEAEAALQPEGRRPYSALVHLSKQTRERNFINALEAQFAAAGDADARLEIGHALAKSYEDIGEELTAFAWLGRAKAGKAALAAPALEAQRALFTAAARVLAAPKRAAGHASAEPIFVVGMPRTGTTLIDRILSSHPEVMSAGELGNFAALVQARTGAARGEAEMFARAADLDFAELGRAYIESTRPLTGAKARFVDKMPLNVLYAPLIHRALPNARIVCLRRHPMDACLSNYRQLFGREARLYFYTYTLETTAAFYAAFAGLVARLRASLPADRFLELSYEDVVADLEGQTRRLLTFCDLPWDARCLAFHENEAPTATASSVQVRAPLYASSVNRWKRLGDALTPLAEALTRHGVRIE